MKRVISIISCLAIVCLLFSGCGKASENDTSSVTPSDTGSLVTSGEENTESEEQVSSMTTSETASASTESKEQEKEKELNVLFIGNSFTYYNDMPTIFKNIANSAGIKTKVKSVTVGSAHLSWFTDPAQAISKDFTAAINSGVYDYAFLQSAPNDETFVKDVANLTGIIKDKSPDCKVYLYETWGYKKGHSTLKQLNVDTKTHAVDYYVKSYKKAADANALPTSHAGIAHYKVYTETPYDPYHSDLKHPSYYGSFVAALTHFYTLFPDKERTSVTFRGGSVDDNCFEIISKIAYSVAHDENAVENFING